MTIREFLHDYSSSALGLGSHFFALGAGLVFGLPSAAGRGGIVPGCLAFLASVLVLDGLFLLTGLGPRSAAAEASRRASVKARRRLEAGRQGIDSLAHLRLAAGPVAQARDRLVIEARAFLEDAGRSVADPRSEGMAYDPRALAAMEESLALVDAWQREADETALERRFNTPDAHPVEDADARVAAALVERIGVINRGRELVTGEVAAADRISIQEELK